MARFSCVCGIILGICSAGSLLASGTVNQFNMAMNLSIEAINYFCKFTIELKKNVEDQLNQIDKQITTYGKYFPSVREKWGSKTKSELAKKMQEINFVLPIVQSWKTDFEKEMAVATRLNDKRPEFQNLVERLEGLMTTEAAERDKAQVDVLLGQLASIVQFALNGGDS